MIRLALTLLSSHPALSQIASDYFPLAPGTSYTYSAVYRGQAFETTVISEAIQSESNTVLVFVNQADTRRRDQIIGTNMIGLGAYAETPQGIITYESFWKSELNEAGSATPQLLLRRTLKKHESTRLKSKAGKVVLIITVLAFETVSVPAGTFSNAVKLRVRKKTAAGSYDEYVWLGKGVGVVKWIRDTGRIDSLVRVEKRLIRERRASRAFVKLLVFHFLGETYKSTIRLQNLDKPGNTPSSLTTSHPFQFQMSV